MFSKRGYEELEEGETPKYLGDQNKYYLRFRHQYENRLSYGFTGEKDAGEEFFKGSNKQGFDFYSGHIFLQKINKTLEALALGDFEASMGQGLILNSGLGYGKSSDVMNIKRNARPIKQYTSVNEANFLRGAGATLNFGDHLKLTAFGSYRLRDANLLEVDTTAVIDDGTLVSSLQESGLHRTEAEQSDENAIRQITTGGSLGYKNNTFGIRANVVYSKLNAELQRTPYPYNQFNFSGDALLNASLDYSLLIKNFNFFGETAVSDNGGIATLNGFQLGLDRIVSLAVLHRYYQPKFQTLFGNPFGESSTGINEQGLYLGMEIKPSREWTFSSYFDTWKHPWLRSGIDAPSGGFEYLVQAKHRPKRGTNIYVRWRDELKKANARDNETRMDFLTDTRRMQLRLHVGTKVTRAIELRNRFEMVLYDDGTGSELSRGFMVLQDVVYKPMGSPLSLTGRVALFRTDDYNSRIYSYENDILYSFTVPPYYYHGARYYVNLRYRPISLLTMEFRIAQTYFANRDIVGSGFEEINGNKRTEIKAQVRLKF